MATAAPVASIKSGRFTSNDANQSADLANHFLCRFPETRENLTMTD